MVIRVKGSGHLLLNLIRLRKESEKKGRSENSRVTPRSAAPCDARDINCGLIFSGGGEVFRRASLPLHLVLGDHYVVTPASPASLSYCHSKH